MTLIVQLFAYMLAPKESPSSATESTARISIVTLSVPAYRFTSWAAEEMLEIKVSSLLGLGRPQQRGTGVLVA
jgi:hypothetical protein